nr:MAG TPA: Protein of unknown function (DUF1043) [Caudoviricetes sp.]
MKDEYKLMLLENKLKQLTEDFEVLQNSISKLPTIVLVCFLLGMIAGFLI